MKEVKIKLSKEYIIREFVLLFPRSKGSCICRCKKVLITNKKDVNFFCVANDGSYRYNINSLLNLMEQICKKNSNYAVYLNHYILKDCIPFPFKVTPIAGISNYLRNLLLQKYIWCVCSEDAEEFDLDGSTYINLIPSRVIKGYHTKEKEIRSFIRSGGVDPYKCDYMLDIEVSKLSNVPSMEHKVSRKYKL